MHGDMGAWAWGMMVIGPLLWLGFSVLLAWAAWAVVRPEREPRTPLDVLKATYARGRMTRDQFEQMKKDLG